MSSKDRAFSEKQGTRRIGGFIGDKYRWVQWGKESRKLLGNLCKEGISGQG